MSRPEKDAEELLEGEGEEEGSREKVGKSVEVPQKSVAVASSGVGVVAGGVEVTEGLPLALRQREAEAVPLPLPLEVGAAGVAVAGRTLAVGARAVRVPLASEAVPDPSREVLGDWEGEAEEEGSREVDAEADAVTEGEGDREGLAEGVLLSLTVPDPAFHAVGVPERHCVGVALAVLLRLGLGEGDMLPVPLPEREGGGGVEGHAEADCGALALPLGLEETLGEKVSLALALWLAALTLAQIVGEEGGGLVHVRLPRAVPVEVSLGEGEAERVAEALAVRDPPHAPLAVRWAEREREVVLDTLLLGVREPPWVLALGRLEGEAA